MNFISFIRLKIFFPGLRAGFTALLLAAVLTTGLGAGPGQVSFDNSINKVTVAPTTGPLDPRKPYLTRSILKPQESAALMTFEVALKMRNFAELQARVGRGEHIPFPEMAAKYEPLPADYQKVVNWLTSQGLTIVRQDSHHLAVFARGTVSQVQKAMQVNFARVTSRGNEYTSAVTAPLVPASFSNLLVGINGLQPHIQAHKHIRKPNASTGTAFYNPAQIAQAYQATGLYNSNLTGAGQTIAVVIDTFPAAADLVSFWDSYGINQTMNNITFVTVPGVMNTLPPVSGEETLDTEWTSSMAPGAKVRVYAASDLGTSDLDAAYRQVLADVSTYPIHQMSMSYGEAENETTQDQVNTDDVLFLELYNAGVTIFASSGDEGSTPGVNPNTQMQDESGTLNGGAGTPASDPYVIGVGGTTLQVDSNNNETSEIVWNNSIGASGGGTSIYFNRPSWQTGTGVDLTAMRQVPDISCAADPNFGADIFYQGGLSVFGGTSWACPTCAAFCALINQALQDSGQSPLGQGTQKKMGQLIYPLIGSTNFRDITSGNNATPNSSGLYTATTGYDEATGIGVPLMQTLTKTLVGSQTLVGVGQPTALVTVNIGQNATISVSATGNPMSYQWERMPVGSTNWTNVTDNGVYSGSASATLTVTTTTPSMSGDQFLCKVTYAGVGTLKAAQPTALIVETPWIVSTFAGDVGVSGLINKTGTAAEFNYPAGIAVDSSGNLYIADLDNNVIRKVTTGGVVSTPYGSGTAGHVDATGTNAQFNAPRDITIDSSNNLYVSDVGSNFIRKINTTTNAVTTIAGTSSTTSPIFNGPRGIAVDSSGNVYVADSGNNIIRKITTNGTVSIYAGSSNFTAGSTNGAATSQALFNEPLGMTIDSSGNLYVTEYNNEDIRKITPLGVVTTIAGQAGIGGCLDGIGTQTLFNLPRGITVDSGGNLYVTDSAAPVVTQGAPTFTGNDLLRKITPAGVVTTLAGQAGNAGTSDGTGNTAQFYSPIGLTVGTGGRIFLVDAGNNTVREATVAPTATIAVSASPGNGGTLSGGGTFLVGSSVTVTATPNTGAGYSFVNWTVNGNSVSTSASYTFTVGAATTLVANFSNISPPSFTSATSTTFALNQAGTFMVRASGNPAPTFSQTGLPGWAQFNPSTGVITGTPLTTTGSPYTINLTAANGNLPNAIQTLTLNVQPTQPFTGNATAIPQNDGVPNLLKYAFDINPAGNMSSSDFAAMPASGTTTSGGTPYVTLTYRQYSLKTGITINVQSSNDLQTWTTVSPPDLLQQVGNDSITGDPIMQIGVKTNGLAKQFLRLNITQP